jgi:hypothetical protein
MNEISECFTYGLRMVGTGKPKYPAVISDIPKYFFLRQNIPKYLHLHTYIYRSGRYQDAIGHSKSNLVRSNAFSWLKN